MTIGFHNFSSSPFASINRDYSTNNFDGSNLRVRTSPLQQRHMRERAAEREREMQMREMENRQMERLNEQMDRIRDRISHYHEESAKRAKNGLTLTPGYEPEELGDIEALRNQLDFLGGQVGLIKNNRANRAELATEREAMRQQAELEEQLRLQEERLRERAEANAPEPQTEEELEQAIANEATRGLTMMSVRMDNIRYLSGTRARLQAKSTRLENEIGASQSRQEQWSDMREGMEILEEARIGDLVREMREEVSGAEARLQAAIRSGDEASIDEARDNLNATIERSDGINRLAATAGRAAGISHNPAAYSLSDGYHGRKIPDLNGRISRLGIAIMSEVSAMYRDSQAMQENQLRLAQMHPNESEDDASGEYESEQPLIDVSL